MRFNDRRRGGQAKADVFGSDNFEPPPQHLFRFGLDDEKFVGRERRLFHPSAADGFLQYRAQFVHAVAVRGSRAAPDVLALVVRLFFVVPAAWCSFSAAIE